MTLITTRNNQKLKLLPFIFNLLILNFKIVSMNLVAKKWCTKETPYTLNHTNDVVNLNIPSILNSIKTQLKAF